MDPLTGRAVIDIPLGDIAALDLSVGVGLSHNGGALRVNEGPGNAGIGWQLSTGGYSIVREVRGLPDDFNLVGDSRKGWLFDSNASSVQGFNTTADDNLAVCTDESSDWTYVNGRGYIHDPEPDIFYFNAPGISGKFVFGSDGLPKLIPFQDLTLTYSPGSFSIKTNTGIVYTFNSIENTIRQAFAYKSATVGYFKSNYNYYQTALGYVSSWKLSSISSMATGATANYTYGSNETAHSTSYVTTISPSSTSAVDTLYYIEDISTTSPLTDITLMNYSIHLAWSNALVDKITMSESETGDIKEYDLVYKSVINSFDLNETITKPFLMQVKQQKSCMAFPSYLFTYYGLDTLNNKIAIPWRTGWGEDHFGYYNGQNSNANVPTVYFYPSESGGRRLRVTPISGGSPTIYPGTTTGSRNVNATYAQMGSLTKISYPTGGVTSIVYEGNKYWDSSTSEELAGAGIRVLSISTSGGDYAFGNTSVPNPQGYRAMKKTYEYKITDGGSSSGKILYPPVFAFIDGSTVYRTQNDLGSGSEVLYSRAKELITGYGSTVYLYDLPNIYPDTSPVVSSSKIARAPTAACNAGSMKNGLYTFPFAPIQDLNYKRGMLRKVSEYSESGALTKERRFIYTEPQAASTIKALKFEAINNSGYETYHYSTYLIPVSQSKIVSQELVKTIGDDSDADSVKVTKVYTYNALNRVTQSTQTNADNSIVKNFIKYAADYTITAPAVGDIQANAIFKLNSNYRTGEIIETYRSFTPIGGSETITSGRLNIFKDYGTYAWPYQSKSFPQGKVFTVSAVVPGATQGFSSDSDYLLDGTYDYISGLPVNGIGMSLMPSSTHYATGTGSPVAAFSNSRSENAIFDGFEMATGRGLTGGTASTPGWTGLKSMFVNGFTLTSANVTKSEDTYRVSFWAYAASSNVVVTVKAMNGATQQASITLTYPTANQWTYLEGLIGVSTATSPFTFQISGSSSIRIDEFVAIPKSATISSKTFLPFTGVTSQTDDRGNSTVISYDVLGRPAMTQDSKRNLLQLTEYGYQKQGKMSLNPNFTSTTTDFYIQQSVTFTAAPTCIPGVVYLWTFTTPYGAQTTASGSSVTKTFSLVGENSVKLSVTAAGYSPAYFLQSMCVRSNAAVGVTFNVGGGSTTIYQCDLGSRDRTFTAVVPGTVHAQGPPVNYTWYITNLAGSWIDVASVSGATLNTDKSILTYSSPSYSYQVKCDITFATSSINCSYSSLVGSGTSAITFVNNSPCP